MATTYSQGLKKINKIKKMLFNEEYFIVFDMVSRFREGVSSVRSLLLKVFRMEDLSVM